MSGSKTHTSIHTALLYLLILMKQFKRKINRFDFLKMCDFKYFFKSYAGRKKEIEERETAFNV